MKTSQGEGTVIGAQVLTQLISIRTDDGNVIAVPVDEVEIIGQPTGRPDTEQDDIDQTEGEGYNDKSDKETFEDGQKPEQ